MSSLNITLTTPEDEPFSQTRVQLENVWIGNIVETDTGFEVYCIGAARPIREGKTLKSAITYLVNDHGKRIVYVTGLPIALKEAEDEVVRLRKAIKECSQ